MELSSCTKGGDSQMRTGWLIQFHYDADFIERLKNTIHHTEREWREDSKTWWVSEAYEPELTRLFSNFYALTKLQGKLL